jgi:hypothetical protein
MDYNGNPVGGGMGAQTNMGGPQMIGGAYGQPIYGGRPNPGDLYNRGANQIGQQIGIQPGGPGLIGQVLGGIGRFQPRGMIPPAGARPGEMTGPYTRQRAPAGDPARYGNPRQLNPGQGGMRPGMPPGQIGQPGGPTPMPMPFDPMPGRGKGGGGGKGGMPGPGGPVIDDMRYKGPPMFIGGDGKPTNDHGGGAINMNINPFNPAYLNNEMPDYRDAGTGISTGDAGG